jgi:hypothetical protein
LAPLGNELVQHRDSAAFQQLDNYATDEALRDRWLGARSTGLNWITRLRLCRLLGTLGPRELLDDIQLEDDEGDRQRAEQTAAEFHQVLSEAGFRQVAGKPNEWLAPADWPERARQLREREDPADDIQRR